MRVVLHATAAKIPGAVPVSFDRDDDGTEFARIGPGLAVGWDDRRRLVLIDTRSGFIERGPFADVLEVCELVLFLAGVRGFGAGGARGIA